MALPDFCSSCGERLPALRATAIGCPSCGARISPRSRGEARLAALLSLLIPGAGQVYNGQFFKGMAVLATFWLVVPWVFGVIDAWRVATSNAARPNAPQIL